MPSATFKNEIKHIYEKDSIFNQYKPLAKKYQVDLCLFSFMHIKHNLKMMKALVFSCKKDNLIWKPVSVPRVNIVRNTSYVVNQRLIKKFELFRSKNIHFINFPLYLQANKLKNYEYLSSFDDFKSHIPPVKILSFANLNSFIRQYGKVIIKPIYGSKGKGITIIERNQDGYHVYQNARFNLKHNKITVPHLQIKNFYNKAFRRPASFLVQQWIPFKECNGLPFDIRAVVQKNGKGEWQVTSRVARVAREKGQITNLNQGGEMVSLSELQLKEYYRDIQEFCLDIAENFEKLYPWAAEMGIDLAIDKKGKLWYIETNYCPEKVKWSTIYKVPFEHAYYMYINSPPHGETSFC